MKEIHLSKNSYCSFRNPLTDSQFDIILFGVNEINNKNIQAAKQNKVARILKETGEKRTLTSISHEDLVFRIMTWEHIPMLPPKVAKSEKILSSINLSKSIDKFFDDVVDDSVTEDSELIDIDFDVNELTKLPTSNIKSEHIRINFPPFFHYRLGTDKKPYIVGKSHWLGDVDTGCFSKTHGNLTDTLARMIMKLCEKYASKGNWRNYSYREEMEGQAVMQLCQVILQFDESKSQNPFAFATSISHNSFLRILNIEKKNQKLRDDLLVKNNMNPSYSRSNQNINYDGGIE